MAETESLPNPESVELIDLVRDESTRRIYGFLYRRRAHPPTMVEIRAYMAGFGLNHSQIDRRTRSLREAGFRVAIVREGRDSRYLLDGWRSDGRAKGVARISAKTRAQILAPQRCAMCGKTPNEDHIRLVVDHKIPQQWGGGDEIENLQPLCEECNGGKKAWFATYDHQADRIRSVISYPEVHRRIGELLKEFYNEWVFTELISIVASAQAYQEDYQKRLRELRTLGWKIESEKRYNEGARVRTYYRCTHWNPWPEGNLSIAGEIHRIEKEQKINKEARSRAAR